MKSLKPKLNKAPESGVMGELHQVKAPAHSVKKMPGKSTHPTSPRAMHGGMQGKLGGSQLGNIKSHPRY